MHHWILRGSEVQIEYPYQMQGLEIMILIPKKYALLDFMMI
jgi:hypothetical protein